MASQHMRQEQADECEVITEEDNRNRVKRHRMKEQISPNTRRRVMLKKSDASQKAIIRRSPKNSIKNARQATSTNRDMGLQSTEPLTP